MVPDTSTAPTGPTTAHSPRPHLPNQHNTTTSTRPQPPVVPHRLLRQRQQLAEAGLSSDAISIALHPAAQTARTRAYSSIQDRFSTWCEERSIQATKAAAADIVNFLAEGRVHLHWEPSTILNYRSALLDMQDDPSRLTHSGAFSAFFTAIDRSALLSFDKSAPDISPILTSFRSLGPSATLSIPDLTRKLCWLLAVTGFMRPSDIARIDASRLAIHADHAYLIIVAPKELRRGRRIERPVHIHRHPDPLICPVDCLTAYKANILDIYPAAPATHPTAPHLKFTPLIRDQRRPFHGIGTQRISKHIQAIMSLITSSRRISGRSLGSDAASKHGASLDEVLTQGFWSAAGVFDTHYRINRRSQTNLTTLALRAPSPHTSSHCCDD
ncbi:hypothetical protein DL89DRAFT_228123 [Linderina pennispora]|uniref:Tyr recombinase domain-containing protein n=1 Tax=Linderina pennispora TaxID=61395 RepID=A0A1Y1VVA3_9FUNG|nr:uncharacterized protein DL89DRAFT_228123 [Linderina pennispora]ORX65219.1 hypothetical protein DL89DRAFT_228123 [Linderina pennispora]